MFIHMFKRLFILLGWIKINTTDHRNKNVHSHSHSYSHYNIVTKQNINYFLHYKVHQILQKQRFLFPLKMPRKKHSERCLGPSMHHPIWRGLHENGIKSRLFGW